MCLAVPGKIVEIDSSADPVMAKVSFGGVEKQICLEWLPDAVVGDYVLVHVGFAISKVDEKEAVETLRLLQEIDSTTDDEDSDDGHRVADTDRS